MVFVSAHLIYNDLHITYTKISQSPTHKQKGHGSSCFCFLYILVSMSPGNMRPHTPKVMYILSHDIGFNSQHILSKSVMQRAPCFLCQRIWYLISLLLQSLPTKHPHQCAKSGASDPLKKHRTPANM